MVVVAWANVAENSGEVRSKGGQQLLGANGNAWAFSRDGLRTGDVGG
jgi:hypothetical protein